MLRFTKTTTWTFASPQENDALKLEKVKETKCGSLTRTQGKQPLLQLRVKTRADVPDPAASLREECARLLKELDKNDGNLTKISTKSKVVTVPHVF